MIYDIVMRLAYDYASPAAGGRHLVRLLPADLPGQQRLVAGRIAVSPDPQERRDSFDFFGNPTTAVAFQRSYASLTLKLQARVERLTPAAPPPSTPLDRLGRDLAACHALGADSPLHFRSASPRAPLDGAMTAYARDLLTPGMTTRDAVLAVGQALHRDMAYDPDATEVDTPSSEAFAKRHGVCQDFSHIMIACLRGIGIPAGYVSGFLRTRPPPGKPRLEGADAMHAWVRAWCGTAAGWIDYDPTNALVVGTDHIVVAQGRDYFDVAPIKGVLRISGRQRSKQSVDVIPLTG